MATPLLLKRSSVQGKVPATTSLQLGELALNTYDGNIFFKKSPNGTDSLITVSTNNNLLSYIVVTSNTTAVARQSYIANTSAGNFTITLPATPNSGDWVVVADGANFSTTPVTIGANGQSIDGISQNLNLDIAGVSVTLTFNGTTWLVYTQVGANGGVASGGGSGSTSWTSITGKPTFATVATSGSYTDLINQPTLAPSATTDTTNASNITSGTLPNARLSSVPNSALANSSVTIGTTTIALGASSTTLTGLTSVTSTSFVGALTGNASTVTNGVYTTDTGTVTNTMLAGSIANAKLANSTISGVSLGSNLNTLTFGTGLTGTSYNGSSAVTIALDTTAVKNLFSVTSNSAGTEALSYSGGVFTFTPYALPTATTSTLGGVTVDGSTITISGSTISATSFQPNGVYNITSSGGTTTLTASTATNVTVTGSATQTIKMPDATTLKAGWIFRINNNTSSASSLNLQDSTGAQIGTVPQGGDSQVILLTNSTAAGTWDVHGWIPSNILMGSSILQLGSSSYSIGPYNSSLTIGSASSVSTTYNFGTGATTSGNTKAINIGTAGVSGSTTTITLGSNVSGATSSTVVNGSLSVTTSGSTGSITVTDTGTNGGNIALVGNGSTTPNKYLRSYNGSFGIVNSGYTASIINISDAGMISTGGASTASNNIPTGNAISLNSNGYISDDGNLHITSSSGSIWINPVDSSAVRIGTQYNSGSGAGLVVQGGITSNTTDPSQGTYFTKVQTNWNVNQPSLAMDNLNVRLNNSSGNNLLIQASAVSGSFTAYITTFESCAGNPLTSQTNSGGITFTAGTWTSINAVHTLSSGGDVIFFFLSDTTSGKIYRVTCLHTNGATNGSIFIERMV
jgi:hypothetical protein